MKNIFLFASFIMVLLITSCVSTTVIDSVPTGAKVYIEDEIVGTTPYKYKDSKIIMSEINVKLVKEGYAPYSTVITKNEKANVPAIVTGCVLFVPWFWAFEYKAKHTYELRSQ